MWLLGLIFVDGLELELVEVQPWVELLLARTLTAVDAKPIAAIMTRTIGATGIDWGLLAAAGVLTIVPGVVVVWFVRNHVAKGFALGRV